MSEASKIKSPLATTDDSSITLSASVSAPTLDDMMADANKLLEEINSEVNSEASASPTLTPSPLLFPSPLSAPPSAPIDLTKVKKTVVLRVSWKKPGISKSVKSYEIINDDLADLVSKDDTMVRVMKTMFEAEEFDRIVSSDQTVRNRFLKLCLPVKSLGRGFHCLPMTNLKVAVDLLKAANVERAILVDELRDAYPERMEETTDKLREEHGIEVSEKDIPSVEEFCGAFSLTWAPVTLDVPSDLVQFDEEVAQEEKQKREEAYRRELEEARNALRAGTLAIFEHLSKVMKPDADGKVKSLRQPAIKNLEEFLTLFDNKNITNDGALEEIVARARRAFGGEIVVKDVATGQNKVVTRPLISADEIKKNVGMRTVAAAAVEEIKEVLGKMVEVKATRRVIMDEEV